jgi:hypothetical protein
MFDGIEIGTHGSASRVDVGDATRFSPPSHGGLLGATIRQRVVIRRRLFAAVVACRGGVIRWWRVVRGSVTLDAVSVVGVRTTEFIFRRIVFATIVGMIGWRRSATTLGVVPVFAAVCGNVILIGWGRSFAVALGTVGIVSTELVAIELFAWVATLVVRRRPITGIARRGLDLALSVDAA